MSAVGNRFDRIAHVYDTIARLVFGNSIKRSHLAFLEDLPNSSNILVLGGGSGAFIPSIPNIDEREIWYLDPSPVMLSLATRQLKGKASKVRFVNGTEMDIPVGLKVSAVITHYYLDMFSEEILGKVIRKIDAHCEPDVKWIVSDFVKPSNFRQRFTLWLMYRFFRILTKIEAKNLPDWEKLMAKNGYRPVASRFYHGQFIKAVLFDKINVRANTI